jgi:hypothetical protein
MDSQAKKSWYSYLNSLSERPRTLILALTDQLANENFSELPTQAGIIADDTIQIVWDIGIHHLDIEIFLDHSYEWFYRNRACGDADGGAALIGGVCPDELVSYLRSISDDSNLR